MEWKYWLTTGISLWAAWIAWGARKAAQKASSETFTLQKRAEQYQHFPLVSVTVAPDGDRAKVSINNTSATNSVLAYKATFILRISAGNGTITVDKDNFVYRGGPIGPNTSEYIPADEINECIAHALPALQKYPSDQNRFVLRVYVECTPPHKDSEKIYEEGVGYFAYENGHLQLKSEP
ncbi:hypothetical protein ACCD10_25415 [Pseudomonas sp. Pseusp122]|uniref:hypothetical protein n=1 Tax=unclassified Pseudomonas TaxID=196821 RepID=UPI0039A626B5